VLRRKRFTGDDVKELTGRTAEEWKALKLAAATYWVTTSDMCHWEEWDGIGRPQLRIGMTQEEFERLQEGRTSLASLSIARCGGDADEGWFVYQTAALADAVAHAQTWEFVNGIRLHVRDNSQFA